MVPVPQWHPDKNQHQIELATETFKDIQGAYAVLSDPQERSWYDAHRESILRGRTPGDGGGDEADDSDINLWAYFSGSAYDGFGDDEDGFYAVYAVVFAGIDADEKKYAEKPRKHALPPFGTSASEWKEVRAFYGEWESFSTGRTCAGADQYDTRAAPNRQIRRAMEKENNKARAEVGCGARTRTRRRRAPRSESCFRDG